VGFADDTLTTIRGNNQSISRGNHYDQRTA
jgi:hypothetical protein